MARADYLYAARRHSGPGFEFPSAEPHVPAITALWQIAIIRTSWGRRFGPVSGPLVPSVPRGRMSRSKMVELLVAVVREISSQFTHVHG